MKSIKEQKKEAKAYRKTTSRSDLGIWNPERNRSVVRELLLMQEETRLPQLIPERRKRMSVSPFTFFRGSAILQAHDASITPRTPFVVQACGDAHIANFGIFGSPERRLVFDINDFDETLPAPFEVDVKRLTASVEICGRDLGLSRSRREAAVFDSMAFYRKALLAFSEMGNMEVWYEHLDIENHFKKHSGSASKKSIKEIRSLLDKASGKNSDRAIAKLTETVDGKLRVKSMPPLIVPTRDIVAEDRVLYDFQYSLEHALDLEKAIKLYRETLPEDRRQLLDQYEILELAHKVVGVGSVGRRAWILVMMGRKNGDPLVLQLKEAEQSVLEEYYGASRYKLCGQRVVEGQRAIQTAGDILLGWLRVELPGGRKTDYYVRQLWDSKGSVDLTKLSKEGYHALPMICAWTLAHAHAKTGNRHALAGYLGKDEAFENAMVKYASSYADQAEADYEVFLKM